MVVVVRGRHVGGAGDRDQRLLVEMVLQLRLRRRLLLLLPVGRGCGDDGVLAVDQVEDAVDAVAGVEVVQVGRGEDLEKRLLN